MMNRKAQAAMEFLMTYGWAILVVMVVVGALAYFGVLNPTMMLPERCVIQSGFDCVNYKINAGAANFEIRNSLGDTITITGFKIKKEATLIGAFTQTPAGAVLNGQKVAFASTTGTFGTLGDKQKFTIEITYYKGDAVNFAHTVSGELLAKIEA
jgi:hypothetical protein